MQTLQSEPITEASLTAKFFVQIKSTPRKANLQTLGICDRVESLMPNQLSKYACRQCLLCWGGEGVHTDTQDIFRNVKNLNSIIRRTLD